VEKTTTTMVIFGLNGQAWRTDFECTR